jgi:hypothetical protein
MMRKIWNEGMKEVEKIEDKDARVEAVQRLLGRPMIKCLNDLDKRLNDLDKRLRKLETK